MSRCRSRRAWCLSLGLALLPLCWPSASPAQFGGMGGRWAGKALPVRFQGFVSDTSGALKEPVASRVYQRDRNGRADIPIVLGEKMEGGSVVSAAV